MDKKLIIVLLVSGCGIFSIAGIYLGYARMIASLSTSITTDQLQSTNLVLQEYEYPEEANVPQINPETKIIYRHYDINSGETQVLETLAPNFMLRNTRKDIENSFTEWDILSFTDNEVIMQRTIDNRPNVMYTLGIQGEFIAVFYGDKANNNLKELTNVPVSPLPEEEKERLLTGIPISNEEELIRRLEDYSS